MGMTPCLFATRALAAAVIAGPRPAIHDGDRESSLRMHARVNPAHDEEEEKPVQFASYQIEGRSTFGCVVGDGVVDLGRRLAPRFRSLLEVLRAGALPEVMAHAAGVRADYALAQVRLLPPVVAPEKI